ncbi:MULTISPECIES: SoxR reducing system RseC family protein [unclassified Arsukibacterium]|uniref:SoxR reducing system RseC family protein n=1 Tax=unclassified Arsukibacterium TaxID=2635278 RepID=UPI000C970490|nr:MULTISPECIES: SoxR reducing system RseC family protein [unclassified Arsukibacterium]MAA95453.1 sigma E positive regulator RseC/MucC [Rheinheimera sp.]|tara:strand:+ start:246403 stop:246855 length:453 start_codon:yes stop_codon:yes gene_type:complete
MIEQIATVLAVEKEGVWLGTTPVTTCNACHASADCGTGIVAKTMTPRQNRFFVATDLALLPGEQVTVATAGEQLVTAALLVYLLPLVLLVSGALLAHVGWQAAEGWVMLAAATGAGCGFLLARHFGARMAGQQQLSILNVLPKINVRQLS